MSTDNGKGPQKGGGDGGGPNPRPTRGYENWTYGLGAAYADLAVPLNQARYVPGLIELPAGAALRDAVTAAERGAVRVELPPLWADPATRVGRTTSWPVLFDFGDPAGRDSLSARSVNRALGALAAPLTVGAGAPRFVLNAPLPLSAVSPDIPPPKPAIPDPGVVARIGQGGKLVVMAVIDDGLPFAHRNLLNQAGDSTRLEFCWLQSAAADGSVLFGRELRRGDIDGLRNQHGPDEDAIYARSGALDDAANLATGATPTLSHRASHGAHVLDAAAGWRARDPDLDLMRVIAVQLPAAVTIDTTGYRKDGAVMAAMNYIFQRADSLAEAYLGSADAPLPLVINFSYGFTGGPHDGSDPLELAMADLIAQRLAQGKPTELVMPAGNSWADRMFCEIGPAACTPNRPAVVPWRVQPNDATPSHLEIWIPAQAAASYQLALVDPFEQMVVPGASLGFAVGSSGTTANAGLSRAGQPVGEIDIAPFNADWSLARVTLAPTEPRDASLPASPAGLWTVTLTRTGGAPPSRPIACRIQRDTDPFGYRRGGRQSYFDSLGDKRFSNDGAPSRVDNPSGELVRRFGTVNGLATHDQVTVVTSHYADTGRATEYASAGPSGMTVPAPGAVRMSMPADRSTALRGTLASGTRSGSIVRLSGTSMAAPMLARRLALDFMAGAPAPVKLKPLLLEVSQQEIDERPIRLGTALAED